MNIAIDRVSPTLPKPTLNPVNDPQTIARTMIDDAQGPLGVDVAKLHGGIVELAKSDPVLARATHDAIPSLLGPVDSGNFLSDIWGEIRDFFEKLFSGPSSTQNADGTTASSGVDLSTTPATPADAPQTITFSERTQSIFDQQWDNSFPSGSALEQGGTVVFDRTTGEVDVINIGGNGSTAGTFTPNYDIPDPSKTGLLGVFHTHPYDSGSTDISFSGADVAVMINEGHPFIMAQSGEGQFLMMRTAETPANVDYTALNNEQNARIQELVDGGQSFSDAASQAASELATRYHMAYYEGSNGQLNRVNP